MSWEPSHPLNSARGAVSKQLEWSEKVSEEQVALVWRCTRCGHDIFVRRVRSLGISDHPTSARSPWQDGYAERLIGSIRRECLDHVVVVGEQHLRHLLMCYMTYYNVMRTHLSLGKDAPVRRLIQRTRRIEVRHLSLVDCTINTYGFDLR